MYSRNGNPNQHWLEEKVAAFHNADDAIVLASGVAALHALFWTLLKTGDRVVYPKVSYMAVYRLFYELFNRKFGVDTVMVDMTDLEEVRKAITPGTVRKCTERRDIPGSTAFVPSVVGLIIAGEIVNDLIYGENR
jgi:methionine-gamma-lyase